MNFISKPNLSSSIDPAAELPRALADGKPTFDSLDPADRIEFSNPPVQNVNRFDQRSDVLLRETALEHESAVERERAIWELSDRLGADALPTMLEVARRDADPAVRWGVLWQIQKTAGSRAAVALESFRQDPHPEVQSWADLLLHETAGTPGDALETRPARFDEDNPFDQTLPLTISGHALTYVGGLGWFRVTLSPRWFEAIMGRVMACTCASTFDNELIIEKRIKSFHTDKSDHFEIYQFRGLTFRSEPRVANHVYYGISNHTFYPSGKVEDSSVSPIRNVVVGAARAAQTIALAQPLQAAQTERQELIFRRAVHSVRGRYHGTAFVNIPRLLSNNMNVGAGEVQLTDVHHPVVGPLTNTFLYGTFKGKLADLNEDGYVDVNTERCHGLRTGQLDYRLLGVPNEDPFDSQV